MGHTIAGAREAGGPASGHSVGGVGKGLQPRLLSSLFRSHPRVSSPLLQSGLLVPLLVQVPVHTRVSKAKQENPVISLKIAGMYIANSCSPQQNVSLLGYNDLIGRNILDRNVCCLLCRGGSVTGVRVNPRKIVCIFAR